MLRLVSLFFILISRNAVAIENHSASECPSLEGRYFNSAQQLRIIKSHEVSGGRSYTFAPGSRPVVVDGLEHNWGQRIFLVGRCEEKKVTLKFYKDRQVVHVLIYEEINQKGDVKVISAGAENNVDTLIRIHE